VQFFSWVEQAPALKAMATDFAARDARLQKYKQAQVLFVDDLFKCGNALLGMRPTEADIRLAHELLEYRNIHDLPTIVTTELLPARLGELDEALLGRLLERSGKHLYMVECSLERDLRLHESA
jgi:DNA replication protein DnaC